MGFGNITDKLPFVGGAGMGEGYIYIIIGIIVLGLCGFGLWMFLKKKKSWNIKVEFKIPRNIKTVKTKDGHMKIIGTLNKEWGKGFYDAAKGVVFVKRKGKKGVAMKPFDIKQYLSTGNILTVVQTGIEDYRPIRDESYIRLKDINGKEGALVQAVIDTSESKSWKNTFERESKMTYSIKNWIAEHGALVAMGLVLFMNLVGFSIVIARMPK